jgi:hypothetical protein
VRMRGTSGLLGVGGLGHPPESYDTPTQPTQTAAGALPRGYLWAETGGRAYVVSSGPRASGGGGAVWSCPSWRWSVVELMRVSPVAGGAEHGPALRTSPVVGVLVSLPACSWQDYGVG